MASLVVAGVSSTFFLGFFAGALGAADPFGFAFAVGAKI